MHGIVAAQPTFPLATMSTSSLLLSLFQCKAAANAEIFAALETIDPVSHEKERHALTRLMNHIYVVDQIFAAHLSGKSHAFTGVNTPETPTLADLKNHAAQLDQWYVQLLSETPSAALEEQISFTFTDGQAARMSREEIFCHVAMHGGYHRGAVGKVLQQIGITPPRELLTSFLHQQQPERRVVI